MCCFHICHPIPYSFRSGIFQCGSTMMDRAYLKKPLTNKGNINICKRPSHKERKRIYTTNYKYPHGLFKHVAKLAPAYVKLVEARNKRKLISKDLPQPREVSSGKRSETVFPCLGHPCKQHIVDRSEHRQ